jgi:hypothetical protein
MQRRYALPPLYRSLLDFFAACKDHFDAHPVPAQAPFSLGIFSLGFPSTLLKNLHSRPCRTINTMMRHNAAEGVNHASPCPHTTLKAEHSSRHHHLDLGCNYRPLHRPLQSSQARSNSSRAAINAERPSMQSGLQCLSPQIAVLSDASNAITSNRANDSTADAGRGGNAAQVC